MNLLLPAAVFMLMVSVGMSLSPRHLLDAAATAGLFLIAVAPGAPLMTRGVAKKGFDIQIAASYQVWGALLTPLMVPLLIGCSAGTGSARTSFSNALLPLLIAVVITLISDLGRPRQGLVVISQQPLLDLKQSLQSSRP
jgi:predicted Na+-dependent transporter